MSVFLPEQFLQKLRQNKEPEKRDDVKITTFALRFLVIIVMFLPEQFLPVVVKAQEVTIAAKQALLVDGETGTVLFAKAANEIFNPASMTKLLVAETVFDALSRGEVGLDSLFKVSEQAWRKGGAPSRSTTMFASVNSFIRVEDLLRGLIVVQGNDAAYALAEGLSGNEEDFVARMNERARALGMKNTQIFHLNTLAPRTGEEIVGENRSTAADLLLLARYIERTYPHYFPLYSEPAFEWNHIFQRNRNPLAQAGLGVDGFVTGGVEGQGYGLVVSAKQGKRRLFLVLGGLEKERQRAPEAKKLIEWGMESFETKLVYEAGARVAQARLYGGVEGQVDLKTISAIGILLPKSRPPRLKIRAVYDGPLTAPIEEGREVGHLVISSNGGELLRAPLVSADDVGEAGLAKKAAHALFEVSLGWMRKYLAL